LFFFSSHLIKIKKSLVLIAFSLLCLLLLFLSPECQRSIKNKVIFLFSPFQRAASKINPNVLDHKREELDLKELQKKNRLLSEKIANLEAERDIWQETARENKRLRRLHGFAEKTPLKLISAQVIGRDATNWNKVIFIDKGNADGVKRNFPVITPLGLVGRIIETTPHQSKIMTILDSNSQIAVLVERNRTQGVISGTNDFWCQLNYISLREELKEGDAIISSGQGGVFPKGLRVGQVVSVKKRETELFQQIRVTPTVNFSHLEEVVIITAEK